MKRIAFIPVLILLLACKRETEPVVLSVGFSSDKPTTLESVICRATLVGGDRSDTTGYVYRWDWENDGVWDTRYSAVPYLTRTFAEPGEYTVKSEALPEDGEAITGTCLLQVTQGFSPPKASFRILPDSGNFKTVFIFDAGLTSDAEEESGLLTYSWDFDNDQVFDVVEKGKPVTTHQYPMEGIYKVNLLVTDTSGLWGRVQKVAIVNLLDTCIVPVIRVVPEYPSDLDTVRFLADQSYYKGNPQMGLGYTWKRLGYPWSEVTPSPEFIWVYPPSGTHQVKLRVYSSESLRNETTVNLVISRGNRPPAAKVTKNMRFGNILSVFEFNAWTSTDPDNLPSELQARWDFEGDGTWDMPFSDEKKVRWVFDSPGVYQVTLEVMDPAGLRNAGTTDVHVSPYANPTSSFTDIRDEQPYGTVMIGNQWWMNENLKWIPKSHGIETGGAFSYDKKESNREVLGMLYHAGTIRTEYTGENESRNLCPRGWHLPSIEEWMELIHTVGPETAGTDLYYGGKSDFNLLLGGIYGYFEHKDIWTFYFDSIYKVGFFMTNSFPDSASTKIIKLERNATKIDTLSRSIEDYYSVRCVKDK